MRFIEIDWENNRCLIKQMNLEVTQTNSTATTEQKMT